MELITASINVQQLDKTKFIKGKKGLYANLVLIPTPKSEFGDYMIKQDATKEERANKVSTPILGNAKVRKAKNGNGGGQSTTPSDDLDW